MTFKDTFNKKIIPELQKQLNIKNTMAVPRINKIKINVGIGSYLSSTGSKDFSPVVKNIAQITGQRPVVSRSKKAISNFKLRIGMPVGVTVTLRKDRMYDFINKLVNVILPRTRDFRGLSIKSFDGKGNYNIGIKEYLVFPEIHQEDISKNHGLQICITTSAKDDKTGYALLKAMGFPFKKEKTVEYSHKILKQTL